MWARLREPASVDAVEAGAAMVAATPHRPRTSTVGEVGLAAIPTTIPPIAFRGLIVGTSFTPFSDGGTAWSLSRIEANPLSRPNNRRSAQSQCVNNRGVRAAGAVTRPRGEIRRGAVKRLLACRSVRGDPAESCPKRLSAPRLAWLLSHRVDQGDGYPARRLGTGAAIDARHPLLTLPGQVLIRLLAREEIPLADIATGIRIGPHTAKGKRRARS